MDELNLAARFGGGADERMPIPRKRKRKTIPGTGMEKPKVRFEDEDDMGDELDLELDEEPEEDMGEDNPFKQILEDMQGGSASEGRAAARRKKLKGKLPARRFDEEEEE